MPDDQKMWRTGAYRRRRRLKFADAAVTVESETFAHPSAVTLWLVTITIISISCLPSSTRTFNMITSARLLRQIGVRAIASHARVCLSARPIASPSLPISRARQPRAYARHYAVPSNINIPDQSEVDASVSRILSSSSYEAGASPAINYNQACSLLSKLLVQLRTTADLPTVADRQAYQASIDSDILSTIQVWGCGAEDLTQLANVLLSASADPRSPRWRTACSKWRIKPGPTSWILLGQHGLCKTRHRLRHRVIRGQSTAGSDAVSAAFGAGNARGAVGVARLLLQRVQRGQVDKAQWPSLIEEAVKLYTQAGEKGLAEAWYDLATLPRIALQPSRSAARRGYLQRGAELGHSGCLFALGMDHLLDSDAGNKADAFQYFKQAADQGDAQSMFQVGSSTFWTATAWRSTPTSPTATRR